MRKNEGTVQKIENSKKKKTISESYIYSSGRNMTKEKMTNKKHFRHKGKPTTKTSFYLF